MKGALINLKHPRRNYINICLKRIFFWPWRASGCVKGVADEIDAAPA